MLACRVLERQLRLTRRRNRDRRRGARWALAVVGARNVDVYVLPQPDVKAWGRLGGRPARAYFQQLGLGDLTPFLALKFQEYGRLLLGGVEACTSQTCSHCGSVYKRDSGTLFMCQDVDGNWFITARDEGNSCVNILRLNLALGMAVAEALGLEVRR